MAAPRPGRWERTPPTARARSAVAALAQDLIELGVSTFLTVPGAPATALVDELVDAGADVEDALNEKAAAEIAFGRTLAGAATAVVMKGNGALLAAEPLQNAGPHGTVAPLLLVVGDDVDSSSSTVPTDARPLGPLLMVPVFDLGPGELRRTTVATAIDTARTTHRPVILRFTASMNADVATPPDATAEGPLDPAGSATADTPPTTTAQATPAADPFRLSKLSRFLDFAVARADELQEAAERSPIRERPGAGRCGIIAAGATWDRFVTELPAGHDEPALGITAVHPVPHRVLEFCAALDRVLVLEEGRPHLEDAVQLLVSRAGLTTAVIGQASGHVPALGVTSTEQVVHALAGEPSPPEVPTVRPPDQDVETHEYRVVFEALEKVRADTGVDVHTCVGSCISAAYAPYSIATSALNLGGATGVAAGFASTTGRPAIALIGDYGLVHSGLTAHQLAAMDDLPVLTIVLANGRSTKTGGQPSAFVGGPGRHPLDLRTLSHPTAGPERVTTVHLDRCDVATMTDTILGMLHELPATLLVLSGGAVAAGRPD